MDIPDPPEPPKNRKYCDACGWLKDDGKHTNIICRILGWIEK